MKLSRPFKMVLLVKVFCWLDFPLGFLLKALNVTGRAVEEEGCSFLMWLFSGFQWQALYGQSPQ